MVRPVGSSQYPGDAAVLDRLQRLYAAAGLRNRTEAIRRFLHELEGPTQEAKIRRLLRKWAARDRAAARLLLVRLAEKVRRAESSEKAATLMIDAAARGTLTEAVERLRRRR